MTTHFISSHSFGECLVSVLFIDGQPELDWGWSLDHRFELDLLDLQDLTWELDNWLSTLAEEHK